MSTPFRRRPVWLVALADKAGATAIEYGLLAGLIAVAIIVSITAISGSINTKFNKVSSTLSSTS